LREFFACFCGYANDCKLSASLSGANVRAYKNSILPLYRLFPEKLKEERLEDFYAIAYAHGKRQFACKESS